MKKNNLGATLSNSDIVSTNDYQFDYKTGVLQFLNSSVDPSDSQYVYMTAYQYVGTTLATRLELDGGVSGSATSTGSFGNVQSTGNIESSGRIFESGTSVIDHATAMAIVFGG